MNIRQLIERFKNNVNQELHDKLEAESAARRKRNEERMAKIKAEMGEKYILHKSHVRGKLNEPRPV